MKQIAPNYSYNKTTGVITLTGVNIDRDQLLLIVNTTRNVTYYNFADSATTLQAFTQGADTSITLASSVISASSTHANGDALTIYYDDQSSVVSVKTDLDADSSQPCVALAFDSPAGVRRVGHTNGFPIRPMQDASGNSIPLAISGTVTANTGLTPLTDTQLRATAVPVSGSVSVSNFPATQAVSGTVNTYPQQGTAVTNTNFTSTTSATLVSAVVNREVLTVFNEGAGTLFINVGSSASTTSYQVRLQSGEYWEAPAGQLSLQHSAIFGSAGTARVTEVS